MRRYLISAMVLLLLPALASATTYTNSFSTTGSITANSLTLTVASPRSITYGATIAVVGAGPAGAVLNTTVTAITATTVTLATTASTTVTGAAVTGSNGLQSPGTLIESTPGAPLGTTANPLIVKLGS